MSFFVGMININEMYKVCSDFCGVRRWKCFLICVGVMVVYSSICVLVFCLWLCGGAYVRFLFFFVCCDAYGRINICKTKFSSPV